VDEDSDKNALRYVYCTYCTRRCKCSKFPEFLL